MSRNAKGKCSRKFKRDLAPDDKGVSSSAELDQQALPAILWRDEQGQGWLVKEFGYEDFKNRLS